MTTDSNEYEAALRARTDEAEAAADRAYAAFHEIDASPNSNLYRDSQRNADGRWRVHRTVEARWTC